MCALNCVTAEKCGFDNNLKVACARCVAVRLVVFPYVEVGW